MKWNPNTTWVHGNKGYSASAKRGWNGCREEFLLIVPHPFQVLISPIIESKDNQNNFFPLLLTTFYQIFHEYSYVTKYVKCSQSSCVHEWYQSFNHKKTDSSLLKQYIKPGHIMMSKDCLRTCLRIPEHAQMIPDIPPLYLSWADPIGRDQASKIHFKQLLTRHQ